MAQALKLNVCLPTNATVRQVIDVVKKYLVDSPAERHYLAYSLVGTALNKAFPCANAPPAAPPAH